MCAPDILSLELYVVCPSRLLETSLALLIQIQTDLSARGTENCSNYNPQNVQSNQLPSSPTIASPALGSASEDTEASCLQQHSTGDVCEGSNAYKLLQAQVQRLRAENEMLRTQLHGVERETMKVQERKPLQIENVKDENQLIHLYTGFQSFHLLLLFFQFLGPSVHNLKFWVSKKTGKRSRKTKLSPLNQLFLTLMKLRCDHVRDLAYRFSISTTFLEKEQFTPEEVKEGRKIASLRIHVERAIGRLKNYRIVNGVIPLSHSRLVNAIVFVCAWLTNLEPVLVPPAQPSLGTEPSLSTDSETLLASSSDHFSDESSDCDD